MKRRAYQNKGLRMAIENRSCIWFWSRQNGKTTGQSDLSLYEMMKHPGRTVVFATATLLLGRELILKDSAALQDVLIDLRKTAAQSKMELQVHDREKAGKDLSGKITADDFTDLFESKRLEFWLYHDRTTFSRTIIIAPSVATARGWTGTVELDEIGHIPDLRELMTAIKPIMQTNPAFRLIMSGTPPEDDTHFSFELFAPPIGMDFAPNPEGHVYLNDSQIPVHRVDLFDAMLAGKKIFHPVTGKETTAQVDRSIDADRDGWDRNHGLVLKPGGTAACGLLQLDSAQRRGIGQCLYVPVDADLDLDKALQFLADKLGDGRVGIGIDVATTTKETSNPTSLTVMEEQGMDRIERLVLTWKTRDPAIATERLRLVCDAVRHRRQGGRARRVCIDATSERYFAEAVKAELASLVPVELVIQSTTVETPGQEETMLLKTRLGDLYVGELDDNHLTLPPERYIKDDHRLVKKDRGAYVCEPQPDGRHGDTFDSGKLANRAVSSTVGVLEGVEGIRIGGANGTRKMWRPRTFLPRRLT